MEILPKKFEVLTEQSKSEWKKIIENNYLFSGQKIYKYPNYLKLYKQDKTNNSIEAFYFKRDNNIFFLPYLKSEISIEKGYYDFETVYGYSGPIIKSDNEKFDEQAWNSFFSYCEEKKIICGVIRFDPFIKNNYTFLGKRIDLSYEGKIAIINLKNNLKLPSSVMTRVRKSEKFKIDFKVSPDLKDIAEFEKIYKKLMKEKNAGKNYFFKLDYFENLKKLKENTRLFIIELNKKIIGGAIVFESNNISSIHLSSVKNEYLASGASVYLRYKIIKYYENLNFNYINLGGGTTNDQNDPLFTFKKKFSNETRDYYIGKCLINKNIYEKINKDLENNNKSIDKKYKNYFLKYKYYEEKN